MSDDEAPIEALEPTPRILQDDRRRTRARPPAPKAGTGRSGNGPRNNGSGASPPTAAQDPELHRVASALREADPLGARTAVAIRRALDQVYDGRRTGRWDFSQLMKTEKTHVGTLVEIWMAREFHFPDGCDLDFRIANVDVDCKWSMTIYGWEIPPEMYKTDPKIALVLWGNERSGRWASGLIRIDETNLKALGGQRDQKRRLSRVGCDRILWLHRNGEMIRNVLVDYPEVAADVSAQSSGQAAVNTLFRHLPGVLVNQATIETAAQQIDSAKRVRDARKQLRDEGIVIFGHYKPHPEIAEALGLPRPSLGRFVSARLAPWKGEASPHVIIDGNCWRLAIEGDHVVHSPKLPQQGN